MPTPIKGKQPLDFPGFDGRTMNRSHLLASQFGGSGGRANIVPLWAAANQGRGAGQMRGVEVQVDAALAQGQRVYYYAVPDYPLGAEYAPNQQIAPYWPFAISITWGTPVIGLQTDIIQNVP
jgi:hypothetical protein